MKTKLNKHGKPVSRQYLAQLKWNARGLCVVCGKPVATKWHCLKHATEARERSRKYAKSKTRVRSKTYRLENPTKIWPGDFIRARVDASGLTQMVFSRRVGIHYTVISQILNNRIGINKIIDAKLSKFLKTPVGYWLSDSEKSARLNFPQPQEQAA